jgi:hypothetical protein
MTCTHEQGKGACWNCHPEMFMYSPEDVARMNAWLAMRQRRIESIEDGSCAPALRAYTPEPTYGKIERTIEQRSAAAMLTTSRGVAPAN